MRLKQNIPTLESAESEFSVEKGNKLTTRTVGAKKQ